MSNYRLIAPDAGATRRAAELSVALIATRYNHEIVQQLIDGAVATWQHHGGSDQRLELLQVPGAFELPLAARRFAASKRYDCVVALGCVIRGDTPHFEYVAGEAARGIAQAGYDTGVPVAFGVLTVENLGQALERAAPDRMNKGGEAMETAIDMALLLRQA